MLASPLNTTVTCIQHPEQLHKYPWAGLQPCSLQQQGQRQGATVLDRMTGHRKQQQAKSARALSCAAANAMQGCSYSFPAKLLHELQPRNTGLPDITTLSQMHAVPKAVCSKLKTYQQIPV